MLWLVQESASHEIISCNTHYEKETNMHQLWVTRSSGKSLLIIESEDKNEILVIKNAIDYAIETHENVLRL